MPVSGGHHIKHRPYRSSFLRRKRNASCISIQMSLYAAFPELKSQLRDRRFRRFSSFNELL